MPKPDALISASIDKALGCYCKYVSYPATLLLVFCVVAFVPSPSVAAPAPQDSSSVSGSSAPPAGKAEVYVYRQRQRYGLAYSPLVFANRDLLAELSGLSYARLEAPQGAVELSATAPLANLGGLTFSSLFSQLRFPDGCGGLDWGHLVEAPPADVARCRSELTGAFSEVTEAGTRSGHAASPFCGLSINNNNIAIYSGFNSVLTCQVAIRAAVGLIDSAPSGQIWRARQDKLRIAVEAGKAYYVKLSYSVSFAAVKYKMTLVDAARGTKEIKGLPLARFPIPWP